MRTTAARIFNQYCPQDFAFFCQTFHKDSLSSKLNSNDQKNGKMALLIHRVQNFYIDLNSLMTQHFRLPDLQLVRASADVTHGKLLDENGFDWN